MHENYPKYTKETDPHVNPFKNILYESMMDILRVQLDDGCVILKVVQSAYSSLEMFSLFLTLFFLSKLLNKNLQCLFAYTLHLFDLCKRIICSKI